MSLSPPAGPHAARRRGMSVGADVRIRAVEFVVQTYSPDQVIHALARRRRDDARRILRVVEQSQIKKLEPQDHIRGDGMLAADARRPRRSPRRSRRRDRRTRRRRGRGARTGELDVSAATGHVIVNPVVGKSEPRTRRHERGHACCERIAGGALTCRVRVYLDPEHRMPVLVIRADLPAAKHPRHLLARARADAVTRRRFVDGGAAVADICADVDAGPIVERHVRILPILSERRLRAA